MLGTWMGLHFGMGSLVMSKGESIIILLLVILIWVTFNQKKESEKIEEPLDKEPTKITMEGSWKRFGKLTFTDSVLTKDD